MRKYLSKLYEFQQDIARNSGRTYINCRYHFFNSIYYRNFLIMTELQQTTAPVTDKELIKYLDTLGLVDKLTEVEKQTFLEIAKAYNLNPFKREIYAAKYGDTLSIITGYEVYLKRSERLGLLDGWEVETRGSLENNDLRAVVTVYRKDRTHPFRWEASYKECVQNTKEGKPNKFWRDKPEFMTKKVAIAQAFRLCFSDELGGMPYTKDEMPDVLDASYTEVPNDKTTNGVTPQAMPVNYGEALEACATLAELQAVWGRIPKKDKPTFEATKNKVKASFKNENQATTTA